MLHNDDIDMPSNILPIPTPKSTGLIYSNDNEMTIDIQTIRLTRY
jgi:hypothetical protein